MSATSERSELNALCEQLLAQQPQSKVLLDRLRTRLDGKSRFGAFAPIRERHCSACHMNVATAKLQRAKSGEFISCAGCSRFLYFESH
jgi:uncharacterized protein YlaI